MLNSVKLDGVDMFERFGCYLAHIDISAPTVQTKFVSVPLRNGALDLTQLLTDKIKYNDRTVLIRLLYKGDMYSMIYSDIVNFCHGKRMEIRFDEDFSYFYVGRISVEKYNNKNYGGLIELKATCNPFKYSVSSSNEDWLWDPFDFEEGYINELSDIVVNGTKEVSLIADSEMGYAEVESNAQMTATYKNKTVVIGVGKTVLYDFEIEGGENIITFTGNGMISIGYRGGRL